jgi:hypothetical protein
MSMVIREISKSTAIASDFQKFPVIFPVLREFGTASLRRIGGEGVGGRVEDGRGA